MSAVDVVARGVAVRARSAVAAASRHGRLLRAADAAEGRNPVVLPPWLAPPAYAASTSYNVGQVVTNGGFWFMCGLAGTTPATGGGPLVTNSGQYVADGGSGVYWTCLGGARAPDQGDGAPTVSIVTASPSIGPNWQPETYPAAYAVRGAAPSPYRSTFWSLGTFDAKLGTVMSAGASVVFESDADRLALFLPANSAQVRVIVGGRYLMPGSHVVGGNDQWMVIDWTGSTGRRLRRYELETGKSASFFGCAQVPVTSTVSAAGAGTPRMVVIGDSYNAGSSYGPWLAGGSIAQLLGKRLGWRDTWNLSIGGTGYLNPSATGFFTFRQRVPQALALAPDVLLLMGSTNDVDHPPAALQAEVLQTMRAIRAGTPAPIIVVGVPSINVAGAVAAEGAVQAGVAQSGDPLAFFVPICGASPPWVLGSWNNGGGAVPSGTVNGGLYVAADNVHPPEIGFDYYAQRIEQAIRAKVLPVLAGA